jgi:hypothetical protein
MASSPFVTETRHRNHWCRRHGPITPTDRCYKGRGIVRRAGGSSKMMGDHPKGWRIIQRAGGSAKGTGDHPKGRGIIQRDGGSSKEMGDRPEGGEGADRSPALLRHGPHALRLHVSGWGRRAPVIRGHNHLALFPGLQHLLCHRPCPNQLPLLSFASLPFVCGVNQGVEGFVFWSFPRILFALGGIEQNWDR